MARESSKKKTQGDVLFPESYKPGDEKEYFGEKFLFKGDTYPAKKWVLVARTKTKEEITIEVHVISYPVQFWEFRIFMHGKPIGKLFTGSGGWYDYKMVYELLARDMIGILPIGKEATNDR